jgi:hypothetical protein
MFLSNMFYKMKLMNFTLPRRLIPRGISLLIRCSYIPCVSYLLHTSNSSSLERARNNGRWARREPPALSSLASAIAPAAHLPNLPAAEDGKNEAAWLFDHPPQLSERRRFERRRREEVSFSGLIAPSVAANGSREI